MRSSNILNHILTKCKEEKNGTQSTNETQKRQSNIYNNSKQNKKNQCSAKSAARRNKIMMLTMYAIKDELNGFTSPIPFLSEELAKRYLKDQVLGNPTIGNSPKDFAMYQIGFFDTETEEYKQVENKLIERAENYANK